MAHDKFDLAMAIAHAVNYHSLDAKLEMSDFKIGELLAPEVQKYLDGVTDAQIIERMSPEDRAAIGHDSDCAMHNMPATPNGPCDCSLSGN